MLIAPLASFFFISFFSAAGGGTAKLAARYEQAFAGRRGKRQNRRGACGDFYGGKIDTLPMQYARRPAPLPFCSADYVLCGTLPSKAEDCIFFAALRVYCLLFPPFATPALRQRAPRPAGKIGLSGGYDCAHGSACPPERGSHTKIFPRLRNVCPDGLFARVISRSP